MHRLSITLGKGKVLLVKGKAHAVCKGDVSLLGVNMNGRSISIRYGKILPFEADSDDASVMLELYDGEYSVRDASEGLGTSIWRYAEQVFEHYTNSNIRPFKVMLIGGTDSGKSTLTSYIANLALTRGLRVGIVDADIGQGDIAPPACMGSCILNDYIFDLRDVKGSNYYFIGKLSPMGIEGYVIQGLKHLIGNVKSDICIINTDGYIDDYGSIYKIRMVDAVKPDMVVILGSFNNMQDVKSICKSILNLSIPREVYKSRGDRIARRVEQYRRFINADNSRLTTFRINSKEYEFIGKSVVMMSNKGNYNYKPINNIKRLKDYDDYDTLILSASILNGMFVALSMYNTTVGFGLILSVIDGYVKMMSSYEGEFDKILLSNIRLNNTLSTEYTIPLPLLYNYHPQ